MFSELPLLFLAATVVLLCDGKVFKIAWMVPGLNSKSPINVGTSGAALTLAVNAVSKNPGILNGHQIGVKTFETECDSGSGMMAAMTAQNTYDPDVFIGPPCREAMQTAAKYGAFWNLPILSWYNPDRVFDAYDNMIRLHPPMKYLAKALVQVLRDMNEAHVALMYDHGEEWTALYAAVETELLAARIEVMHTQRYVPNLSSDVELDHQLLQMKVHSTTIIFLMSTDDIRRCMLSTVRTGMVNEHLQYIHLDSQIYTDREIRTTLLGKGYWKTGQMNDHLTERAFSHLVHIVVDPMNDDNVNTIKQPRSRYSDFINLGETMKLQNNTGFGSQSMAKLDVYSLYLYDAVSMWSVLADQMLSQNMSHRDGKAMVERAKAFQAEGSTGFISFDTGADRLAKVFVLGMGAGGAFTPHKVVRFDSTGLPTVTQLSSDIGPYQGKHRLNLPYHSSSVSKSSINSASPLSSMGSLGHSANSMGGLGYSPNSMGGLGHSPNSMASLGHSANAMGGLGQSVNSMGSLGNSLNMGSLGHSSGQLSMGGPMDPLRAIIERLTQLEKAIQKVLTHDHTRDHPPHERAPPHRGPAQQQQYNPPFNSHGHTGNTGPPGPHQTHQQGPQQPVPLMTTPKNQYPPKPTTTPPVRPMPDYDVSEMTTTAAAPARATRAPGPQPTGAKSRTPAQVNTLTAQLIAQLSGVIEKKLGSINPQKASGTTRPVVKTTTARPAPPPQHSGENGGQANTEYGEMMARLHEELPPEMHAFMGFGMGVTANPEGGHGGEGMPVPGGGGGHGRQRWGGMGGGGGPMGGEQGGNWGMGENMGWW